MVPEIQYAASQRVRDAITSLGRTEDVRFSPNNRRLAIAAFSRNQIAIFDVDISASAGGVRVALAGGVQIASSVLNEPHEVDFLDDDTVIVASRGGGNVATFRLPAGSAEFHSTDAAPFEIWPAEPSTLVREPSTVSVTRRERGMSEILNCDHAEPCCGTQRRQDTGALGAEEFAFERRLMDELAETQRERTAQAESRARVHYMINSRSWRITAPLRRLDGLLRSRF